MRAMICKTFGGYTFQTVGELDIDDFVEVAGAALWLNEEERKSVKKSGRSGKRRR